MFAQRELWLTVAGIFFHLAWSAAAACTLCGSNDQVPSYTAPPDRLAMSLGAATGWQPPSLLDGYITFFGIHPSKNLGLVVYGQRVTASYLRNGVILWKPPNDTWK